MAVKLLNTKHDDKPLATDKECEAYRETLIATGIIKPAPRSELIEKKDGTIILSTRRDSRARRERLIEGGVLDPTLCQLVTNPNPHTPKGEGEYSPKPIESEEEYDRRKRAYFRVMQEILRSRKDLRLVLGKKNDKDPEWYF